jgi:hypothetical protein
VTLCDEAEEDEEAPEQEKFLAFVAPVSIFIGYILVKTKTLYVVVAF